MEGFKSWAVKAKCLPSVFQSLRLPPDPQLSPCRIVLSALGKEQGPPRPARRPAGLPPCPRCHSAFCGGAGTAHPRGQAASTGGREWQGRESTGRATPSLARAFIPTSPPTRGMIPMTIQTLTRLSYLAGPREAKRLARSDSALQRQSPGPHRVRGPFQRPGRGLTRAGGGRLPVQGWERAAHRTPQRGTPRSWARSGGPLCSHTGRRLLWL